MGGGRTLPVRSSAITRSAESSPIWTENPSYAAVAEAETAEVESHAEP